MTIEPTAADDFTESFTTLAALAYRVAYRLLGNRAEAEDVAQEAMARALVRWNRARRQPEAWVVRVATNAALDIHRRRARHAVAMTRLGTAAGAPGTDSETAAVLATERADLARVLAALPRRQRQAVALRYLADLTDADAARLLGCSPGTVKQHTHRALMTLRATHFDLPYTTNPTPGDL